MILVHYFLDVLLLPLFGHIRVLVIVHVFIHSLQVFERAIHLVLRILVETLDVLLRNRILGNLLKVSFLKLFTVIIEMLWIIAHVLSLSVSVVDIVLNHLVFMIKLRLIHCSNIWGYHELIFSDFILWPLSRVERSHFILVLNSMIEKLVIDRLNHLGRHLHHLVQAYRINYLILILTLTMLQLFIWESRIILLLLNCSWRLYTYIL